MNYKIDYNFLEITNSPSIEYYFEKRAREGWLIDQIYLGSVFVFKKIEPVELDFSIHPYKLTSDPWNYVTESYDLFIYYKKYKAEVDSFIVEPAEEYEILEAIGKKRIQGNAIQIFIFLILGWLNIGGIYTSPEFLKDGGTQLALPFVLIGLTIAGWGIVHVRRFLKINRENIEDGKNIEYIDSMFLVPSTTFFLGIIVISLFLLYFLYVGVVSSSFIPFIFILTIISFFILDRIYQFWQLANKSKMDIKKLGWAIGLLMLFLVGIGFGVYKEVGMAKNPNLDEYKVLTVDTFPEGELEIEGSLLYNMSILIPTSYEYYYISDENEYVETEYSRAIVTDFAKDLTMRYIDEKKREDSKFYLEYIQSYFDEGIFNDRLLIGGITEGDLIRLQNLKQDDAEKIALDLIKERSISEGNPNLWNADEVYFLSYEKDEILIRNGKEVFYLTGKDFTDADVIKRAMKKLGLN